MIFYVGNGPSGLLPFLLLFGIFFVLAPLLLFRGARRAVVLPPPSPAGGWAGLPPAPQHGGWDLPDEPVLPPVHAADVVSLVDRLGHDVRTLEPGHDPVSRQAMADASERLSTARTLLERADSQAQLRTAWLAAVEGLTAARLVRTRLGLDPGPPIPLPPRGASLERPARIDVGGRSHVGGPDYEPGRPHWFPGGGYGGRYVPAGWYDAPFWPSALVLGGLSGYLLGGLAAGTMFGDDLDGDWGDAGWGDGGYGAPGDAGWGDGGGGWGDGGDGGGGWGDGGDVGGGGGWGDGGGGWGDGGGGWGDGGGGGGDGGGW